MTTKISNLLESFIENIDLDKNRKNINGNSFLSTNYELNISKIQ